ncbi:hypothetical protein QO002_003337 [Pararhizobium capsulatum DSM 1112]|uniref:VIT domain-containing protein n=1 Tax=Pararhizobium capsulatum DSM 1112 TaxID=1121113 RepID=A0ABU0BSH1_9HYPH|nr:hypothetical protein [Pararhizobium capsulatum DSM 1112]
MFLDEQLIRTQTSRRDLRLGVALAALSLSFLMLAGLFARALAETPQPREAAPGLVRPNDMGTGALLFPSPQPGYFVEALRLATDVEIDVSGPIMRTRVTQRFQNPSKGWVEVFPLPDDSAVDVMKMQIGDRFIEGEIKPREEARQIYEDAKAEGKKTARLEVPLNLPAGWHFDTVFGEEGSGGGTEHAAAMPSPEAEMVADLIAAAPTARAASMIAQAAKPVALPQTTTLADRHILIGLMLIAIAAMAAIAFGLWRWQMQGLFTAKAESRHEP